MVSPTNNVNKLLLADLESKTLIVCGSVLQGACEKYKLSNISHKPDFIPKSIAANDEFSSTYGFIGPERYNNWGPTNILYVGTTFTNIGDYRHDVPAISSRNLRTLDFAESTFNKESNVQIDVKYRDHFIVRYVYGFNVSSYAYFVLVQKRDLGNEEKGYMSRLARSCVSDPNYDSYTEVTLQCKVEGNADGYNLVQDAKLGKAGSDLAAKLGIATGDPIFAAVFSPSRGIANDPQGRSALCIYSLLDIETKFDENIHMCFNGSTHDRNMGYISGPIQDGKCPTAGATGNIGNFCEVGLKISGSTPIVGQAMLHFPDVFVTSVALDNIESHTVAFLGTDEGSLKKVLITGSSEAAMYESIDVDANRRILPDTLIEERGEYLYVLSNSSLSKLSVQHCGTYTDCNDCLEARDPYCGWCSLEKRCTVRGDCQKAVSSSPRWLSLGTGQQCIDFENVLPDRIPIDQMATVQLTIRTLPELPTGANYKCVFGKADPIDAVMTNFGLSCLTPPVSSRANIPEGADHVFVPLSVRSSETNKDFVSRNFAYFDCSRHTVCSACVMSQWACNWCVYDNKCTHDTSRCQGNVIASDANGQQQLQQLNPLAAYGVQHCPRFVRREKPLMLPNNVPKEIMLEVENLPHPQIGHSGFQCLVSIEGANLKVQARVDSSRFIICDRTVYSYEAATGEYEASVTVVWNTNHHVDETTIVLYKCEVLGSHREHADCSLCMTRDTRFNCTWCGQSCVYRDSCLTSPFAECPRPRIDMIKPLSGPVEGGTLVTIEGSNLGLREAEIQNKIRIGNTPCALVDYEVSVRIVCRTDKHRATDSAVVVVGNNAGETNSTVLFNYKDIKLVGIHPRVGPQSGGTRLAVTGLYLNIGSKISAFLDDLPCRVNATQASSTRLTCITSKSRRVGRVHRLTLSIDGANRTLEGNPFNYTQDPTIMEIKPQRSFASGGRMITVHGTNLDTIQKPEMEVYFENEAVPVNRTVCTVLSATQMECPSPSVIGRWPIQRKKAHRDRRSSSGVSRRDRRAANLKNKVRAGLSW